MQTCSTTAWPLDVLLFLQRIAHGAGHLHELPPKARVVRGSGPDSLQLPGWGARGQDWAEMDRLAEEEVQGEQAHSGAAPLHMLQAATFCAAPCAHALLQPSLPACWPLSELLTH